MFPLFYRHDAYWGAPRPGFCYDSPRMDFGSRPMHHGNPFGSFMGGFFRGLGLAAACGWGNSYVSYPTASVSPVSIFPRSYSPYQSYYAAPSFGYDYSALAFNDAYANFVNACTMPRYTTTSAQMPTSNWATPISSQTWSMPSFTSNGTPSFTTLTQSGRQSGATYSVIPKKPKTQTSVQSETSQTQNSGAYTPIPVKNIQQTAATGVVTTPVDATVPQVTSVARPVIPTAQLETNKPITMQSLIPFKQRYDQILANLNAAVDEDKLKKDSSLNDKFNAQMVHCFDGIEALNSKGTEPNNMEKEEINKRLNELSELVTKCQNKYPLDNTAPKTQEQIKIEEDAFNAVCKGGDCGDYNHRKYYDAKEGVWKDSATKGYPRQPIAPKSMLVEVPEQYAWRSGDKIYLNPEALKHFIEMSEYASSKSGLHIAALSAYRDEKYQQRVLKEEGPAVAAPPGYTEHHTGFITDINLNGQREKSREYQWLIVNAKKFGFERSYPDRVEESQHWRFNPELCEKYKQQREELLKEYRIESKVEELKNTTTSNEAPAQGMGEDFLDTAKRNGMEAEVQRYNEIMGDYNQYPEEDKQRLIGRYPLGGSIADHEQLLSDAFDSGNKAAANKALDALARDMKRFNKLASK